MTTTTIVLLIAIVLLYIAYYFVVPILAQSNYQSGNDQNILNTELYKRKLAELQTDLEAGTIDQSEFSSAENELKLQLLSEADINPDKVYSSPDVYRYRLLLLIVLAVPMLTAFMYFMLGNPGVLTKPISNNPHSATGKMRTAVKSKSVAGKQTENIERLKAKLKANPKDVVTLYQLARIWQSQRQFGEASAAYRKILELIPEEKRTGPAYATFLANYADVLGAAHGGTLKGVPMKFVNQALSADPNHRKALHLAGSYYYRQGDYAGALKFWSKLYKLLPAKSSYANNIKGAIKDAEQKLAEKNQVAKPDASVDNSKTKVTSAAPFSINGSVSIDSTLKYKPEASDVLFIFAKQPGGIPRPLAAIKFTNVSYPLTFNLSDKHLIVPGKSLKSMLPLVLSAKITRSNNASNNAGALRGSTTVTANKLTNIQIIIGK